MHALPNKSPSFYVVAVCITLAPLYYASYRYRLTHPYGGSEAPIQSKPFQSDTFIHDWLSTRIISPFNPSALARYCNLSEWHPNLVFNLENANGGIGNVRGNVLDFLFFAIEAGASIILPGMASRSLDDISNVWGYRSAFDLFFDEEWFLATLGHACPEMAVFKPESHHQLVDALPGNYLPHTRRMDADNGNTRRAYLRHLDEWMQEKPEFQPANLTLLNLERTLWDIDTRSLPMGFRRDFGRLLQINPAVRRFAAIVVQNLAERYNLSINPTDAIPHKAFYGAHLRTENDAKNAGWLNGEYSNFTAQTDAYIAQAMKHDLNVIFVASGNATDTQLFKDKASAVARPTKLPPLAVVSKFDLLPSNEAAALKEMTWDQQALVDYEVLQRCSVFGGIVKSSFSYNIAMTRNQRLDDMGRVTDPWYVMHEEEGVAFDDGLSRILGRDGWHEERIPRGMWP